MFQKVPQFPILPKRAFCFALVLMMIGFCSSCAAITGIQPKVSVNPHAALPTTTTPVPATVTCQAPCECLTEVQASAKWSSGGYTKCSESPCAYTPGADIAPPYCFRPIVTTTTLRPGITATIRPPATTTTAAVSLHVTIRPESLCGLNTTDTDIGISTCHQTGPRPEDRVCTSSADGIPDACDNCPSTYNPDQKDTDGDGIGDACDNCYVEANAGQQDFDHDGFGDTCDICPGTVDQTQTDTDGDGIGDACDLCRFHTCQTHECLTENAESPRRGIDADQDGFLDSCDTCPRRPNPDQADADQDGIGDICDLCPHTKAETPSELKADNKDGSDPWDMDEDGVGDLCDNCGTDPNPDQKNADGDWSGDACDSCPNIANNQDGDDDKDGIANLCDNCLTFKNPDQKDTNNNGIGDACDCADGIQGPNEAGVDNGLNCPPISTCPYCGPYVKPLYLARSPENAIDIVFVASSTSYDLLIDKKVVSSDYTGNEEHFRNIALNQISNGYWKIDSFSTSQIIPDFRDRMNFYYYWRSGYAGDAWDTCAGTLPANFWTDAYFADVGAILYPENFHSGRTTLAGCADMLGPTKSHYKACGLPGYESVPVHEAAHAAFAVVDTYCGDTYYEQNDPYTNVWATPESCASEIQGSGRDPAACRQIIDDNPATAANPDCSKQFWRWDSDPDIMRDPLGGGQFGIRGAKKINYIFQTRT